MMKHRKIKVSLSMHGLLLGLLSLGLFSCGEEGPDAESEEETLAEYVARCESFKGDTLADCPEECELVDAVRILETDSGCEMERDDADVPIREDRCLAAEEESVNPFGYRGVYRRVVVGDTAEDPVTPSEPEEILRLYIHDEMYGWERCTEAASEYCACALQFEDLDG